MSAVTPRKARAGLEVLASESDLTVSDAHLALTTIVAFRKSWSGSTA